MTEDVKLTRDWTDLLKEAAYYLERDTAGSNSHRDAVDLAEEIQAYLNSGADKGEWWCEKCKEIVSPLHVTDEYCQHDKCGTYLSHYPCK